MPPVSPTPRISGARKVRSDSVNSSANGERSTRVWPPNVLIEPWSDASVRILQFQLRILIEGFGESGSTTSMEDGMSPRCARPRSCAAETASHNWRTNHNRVLKSRVGPRVCINRSRRTKFLVGSKIIAQPRSVSTSSRARTTPGCSKARRASNSSFAAFSKRIPSRGISRGVM